jgi:hypothetical protein
MTMRRRMGCEVAGFQFLVFRKMKKDRMKKVLKAAAGMPPAKGRAIVAAMAETREGEDASGKLVEALALAMELAALKELERRLG